MVRGERFERGGPEERAAVAEDVEHADERGEVFAVELGVQEFEEREVADGAAAAVQERARVDDRELRERVEEPFAGDLQHDARQDDFPPAEAVDQHPGNAEKRHAAEHARAGNAGGLGGGDVQGFANLVEDHAGDARARGGADGIDERGEEEDQDGGEGELFHGAL